MVSGTIRGQIAQFVHLGRTLVGNLMCVSAQGGQNAEFVLLWCLTPTGIYWLKTTLILLFYLILVSIGNVGNYLFPFILYVQIKLYSINSNYS
jgi:hypothetical protein